MTAWKKALLAGVVIVLLLNVALGLYNAARGLPFVAQFLSATGLAGVLLLAWFYAPRG